MNADYIRVQAHGSDLGAQVEVKVLSTEQVEVPDGDLAAAVKDYLASLPGVVSVTATAFTTVNESI
ncbi:hypothetical protein [Streptomyces sp. NEAU-174]|uniref:hypothetical protein n=1 Tax=Streptomyces sp. NEAU-174 TaxID=3458254 RepID=UPI004044CE05